MLFNAVKKRWLVAPLAALFLLFSGGAAIAPECHIVPVDTGMSQASTSSAHSSHSHSHSHGPVNTAASTFTEPILSLGGVLNKEICVIVGFIVLLLLRFARVAKSSFSLTRVSNLFRTAHRLLAQNLEHLQLSHLQLGVIRI